MNRHSVCGAALARAVVAIAVALGASAFANDARAQFTYRPPGELVSGSGRGRVDNTVYAPGIRFPIQNAPAYLNSQVWGVGGGSGPAGSQCDTRNFSYPWRDNYCETRSWDMPMCPSGTGHQGQDIRASNCMNNVHNCVAVTDGTITNIGTYSVYLTAADGTRYDYLHMGSVSVSVGQRVTRGQVIGRVSNAFGGTPTTVHLHFNIRKTVSGFGSVYAPTYMSLIRAYESLTGSMPMPMGPRFGAMFVMQSFPYASTTLNLPAGSEQRGYFEFRNTGTETWRPGEVFMGTTQPRDRTSPARGSDWTSGARAATIDRVVAPGATGRFNFSLRAPNTVGAEYSEYFGIVREGVAWFSDTGQGGPADNVVQVRVRAASAGVVDSGVPVPVDSGVRDTGVEQDTGVEEDVVSPELDVFEPVDDVPEWDSGLDPSTDSGRRPPGMTPPGGGGVTMGGCGCVVPARSSSHSRGGTTLAVIAMAVVALGRRRAVRRRARTD
ncbi:MAG: M23 family metallopeptidase [Myxococcales bacterium]|nr:M23 family metallopeptidase [Myxococcales bacterium]